jgi:hypothetical protein
MAQGISRIEALRNAGFLVKSPLPSEYENVIEGLSREELRVLVNLKKRLDKAELKTSAETGSYREYFLPF